MIVDLYAGAGGWEALLPPDVQARVVGFEWNPAACATRRAAGLHTVRCDLAGYPVPSWAEVEGVIASPPCQTFSAAGKGEGAAHLDRLVTQAHRGDWTVDGLDDRTAHVLHAARWVDELRPEWVAFEQVPAVLPVWQAVAEWLRGEGWRTWAGVLNSADYGVPQTRKRAILTASRGLSYVRSTPTHQAASGLFGRPWVTMAEALPHRDDLPAWAHQRPATTVVGTFRPDVIAAPGYRTTTSRQDAEGSAEVSIEEAAALQSFPPDWPWQGSRTARFLQCGNAIPPLLARHVLSAVGALDATEEVAA